MNEKIPIDKTRLEANLSAVKRRIREACSRAGRDPAGVLLVAVAKGRLAPDVAALAALGAADIGENRLQEAETKASAVAGVRWHMIGHLQRNKARKALAVFSVIHSADSLDLVSVIDRTIAESGGQPAGAPYPVLAQVNVSGEDTKSGVEPGALRGFLDALQGFKNIKAAGLMTMAPWSEDPEDSRLHFRRLAELGREAADCGLLPARFDLSMGMTGDFEVAIEEGSTIVRIGTALFA